MHALSQRTREFSRYRWECNCQKAIYIGKVRDWQQLTYLGIVRDSPTAAPIPPSLQALRISRNVSWFTLVDPKMVQRARLELGSDDPQAGTLTTRLPFLCTTLLYGSVLIPPSTQLSTYISKCLEILTPPPLHTTKHLYLEMSRDTLAKNEPRKASIYV